MAKRSSVDEQMSTSRIIRGTPVYSSGIWKSSSIEHDVSAIMPIKSMAMTHLQILLIKTRFICLYVCKDNTFFDESSSGNTHLLLAKDQFLRYHVLDVVLIEATVPHFLWRVWIYLLLLWHVTTLLNFSKLRGVQKLQKFRSSDITPIKHH